MSQRSRVRIPLKPEYFFQASLSQLLKLRINREDLSQRHYTRDGLLTFFLSILFIHFACIAVFVCSSLGLGLGLGLKLGLGLGLG